MRYIYILNSFGLKSKLNSVKEKIEAYSKKNKLDYLIEINGINNTTEDILKKYKKSRNVIIAVGGDGTLNRVLNSIVGTKNILGLIPYGTGNDFYKTCKETLKDGIQKIDLIKINDKHFINVACFGLDADIGNNDNVIHSKLIPEKQRYNMGILCHFLKYKPRINLEVWSEHNISSEKNDFDFAGVPYDEAVEKLMKDMDPGYQEYLTIQKNLRANYAKTHKYEPIRTVAGGVINPVLYATGAPTVYDSSRLITRPKFITIDTQIAYYCGTTKSQVFNRAVIITNLIRALEKRGYNVNVNSFMMTENNSEIIKALFEIKQHGHRTNYQTLYKSLVDVEFFRRLCFRIMEVSDVQSYWPDGYGRPFEEDTVRKASY